MNKLTQIIVFIIILFSSTLDAQNSINEEGLSKLKIELGKKLSALEPGAAVIISYKGKTIFDEYFGLANIEKDEKLSAKHQMGIASMSKQFLGMAVLILVEDEKLSLEDDIRKYFPKMALGKNKISIKQLLSHTNGLPELLENDSFLVNIHEIHSISEILDIVKNDEFRALPGEKFDYCNTGFTLGTALVEKLSGKTYAEFLEENIFGLLKMKNTYSCDTDHDALNIAQRYETDSIGFIKGRIMHFSNLIGGGGIVSNTQDIIKWNNALLSGKKLPKNYQDLWKPILLNSGESTGYGLGMGSSSYEGVSFIYHPGMGDGMNSVNMIFPEYDLSLCVIRNVSKPAFSSYEIAYLTIDLLLQKT